MPRSGAIPRGLSPSVGPFHDRSVPPPVWVLTGVLAVRATSPRASLASERDVAEADRSMSGHAIPRRGEKGCHVCAEKDEIGDSLTPCRDQARQVEAIEGLST